MIIKCEILYKVYKIKKKKITEIKKDSKQIKVTEIKKINNTA